MARRSDNTLRTVRFYEEAGILQPHERSQGGHRLYTERDLERLRFVSELRAVGFSLEAIRTLLAIRPEHPSGSDAAKQVAAALAEHIERIREKARLLARLERELRRAQELLSTCQDCRAEDDGAESCEHCLSRAARGRLPPSLRVLFLDPEVAQSMERPIDPTR
jgi:DNA-binding transcriptional MerR regulator